SATGITTSEGSLVGMYAFSPFGSIIHSSGEFENPFGYAGRYGVAQDLPGLHYMRARYFLERIGRFLQPDPIKLNGGDSNFHRYVFNAPTMGIDPTGHGFFSDIGSGLAGLARQGNCGTINAGAARGLGDAMAELDFQA